MAKKPTVGSNYINSNTGAQWLLSAINEPDPSLGLNNTVYIYKRPGETATMGKPMETLASNNDITADLVKNYDMVSNRITSWANHIDDLYKVIDDTPQLIPKYVNDFKDYIGRYNNILGSASSDFFTNTDLMKGSIDTLQRFVNQYDKPAPISSPKRRRTGQSRFPYHRFPDGTSTVSGVSNVTQQFNSKKRRTGQDHITPGERRYMGFDPTQNVSNVTSQVNEIQTQRTIDNLNHRAATDPTMTVGEYQRQMEATTGVKSTVKPNYQTQIDDLNRRAASDPNMTFGEYQAQMSSLVNEGEGSVDIDRATQRQLDTISQQSAIDDLNKRAATDPSLTFDEYQKQMQNIVGEVQDINYRDQLSSIDEQAAIDELNKRATSDPNLTVDEYKRLMEDITGENKIAWDSAYQQQMDELNRRATTDPNMTMGEYGTRMAELAEQEAVDDINRRAADPKSGMTVEEYMKEMSSVTGEEINLRDVGSTIRNQNTIDPRNRRNVITKEFEDITEGRKYSGQVTNGYVENIKFFDDDGAEFDFEFKHQKDGGYHVYDAEGDLVSDKDVLESLEKRRRIESMKYYYGLDDKQWETVLANPEQFKFDKYTNGEYSGRLMNQNNAIAVRQDVLNQEEQIYGQQLKEAKKKKEKDKIKEARNATGIKNLELQRTFEKNELRTNSIGVKKNMGAEFNKTLGLDKFEKGSKEYYEALKAIKESNPNLYNSAVEKMKEGVKLIDSDTRKAMTAMNERIDGQIKGLSVEPMGLQQAVNLAFTAKTAVDKYKQSRAEGKGVVSSVARSAGSAVIAETVGLTGSLAITAATALPKLAVSGASTLYSEHRRMNSASNFRPLGGVNYQDSQELATMRQSGMELAKMAQYNLEQTLMGSEAKHLHR